MLKMEKSKLLFKLEDSDDESLTPSENPSKIVKYEFQNLSCDSFIEKLLNFLPTPEDEFENMKKDEEVILKQIDEIKEVIDKIDLRLNDIKNLEDSSEFEELSNKKEYYITLLETYEADFEYTKAQKKSLGYLINEDDEDFEDQLPELLANTFVSTKKKMEDVNSVVKMLELQIKKNKIEECIECGLQFKDEQGRKTSLKHFHLEGFEDLKKYKPIICLECFNCYKNGIKDIKIEDIKDIEFEEELSSDSKDLCKKGSKIFNSKNILNITEFKEKGKKFNDLENKEFIENIKNEGKKSLFDSFF